MPRLPVIRRAAAAFLLGIALSAPLQAAVVVRSIDDLRKDPDVAALEELFTGVASANVVYDQCAAAYGITPQQQAYEKQLFTTTAAKYTQSYADAYTKKVGAPPPQNVLDFVAKYINDEQQSSVNRVAQFIRDKTCGNPVVRKIYENIETMHQREDAAKAKSATTTDPWSK